MMLPYAKLNNMPYKPLGLVLNAVMCTISFSKSPFVRDGKDMETIIHSWEGYWLAHDLDICQPLELFGL